MVSEWVSVWVMSECVGGECLRVDVWGRAL